MGRSKILLSTDDKDAGSVHGPDFSLAERLLRYGTKSHFHVGVPRKMCFPSSLQFLKKRHGLTTTALIAR